MIIEAVTLVYLNAVIAKIECGGIPPESSDICKECEHRITRFDDAHLIYSQMGKIWVLIGCEGYWQLRDRI